ncbi:MAG: hypothetical protein HGA45_09320 [Chloroflexales bacterium]|nr:hypothetical protein [Chloroflexales bacterium]
MDVLAGLSYPLRALALLRQTPRLWRYVIVPILVNIVVGAALYLGLFVTLLQQLQARLAGSPFSEVVVAILGALLAVLLAVTIGFVLVRFGVVLGAPWYGQLSEELEGILTGHVQRPDRLTAGTVAYDIWRALLFEGKKLALALAIWLLSLLLLLIPVAGGMLYTAAGLLLGALISCLDFFDGPQERRRLGFRQKLRTIRVTLPGSLSFGLVAFSLVSIPLVNLLAIPLCVAAGNIFVIERALPQATGSARRPGSPASGPAA